MPLTTATIRPDVNIAVATFLVPGHEIWSPRAVRLQSTRPAGADPARGYLLTIDDGTTIVAQVGADDAGAAPGTGDVTWTNTPAARSAYGGFGVIVAPFAPLRLPAGYQITVEILNTVPGDQAVEAVCWYDFVLSG